jgi:3-oxoacyl-[acyl-carrier-protein] synthase II
VRAGLGRAPVSSTKGLHGHCLGAAGGIEAIAALMAIVQDRLPPGINLDDPDDDLDLDHVVGTARPARVDAVLSNSFGFGGHNAALVFRRHEA